MLRGKPTRSDVSITPAPTNSSKTRTEVNVNEDFNYFFNPLMNISVLVHCQRRSICAHRKKSRSCRRVKRGLLSEGNTISKTSLFFGGGWRGRLYVNMEKILTVMGPQEWLNSPPAHKEVRVILGYVSSNCYASFCALQTSPVHHNSTKLHRKLTCSWNVMGSNIKFRGGGGGGSHIKTYGGARPCIYKGLKVV